MSPEKLEELVARPFPQYVQLGLLQMTGHKVRGGVGSADISPGVVEGEGHVRTDVVEDFRATRLFELIKVTQVESSAETGLRFVVRGDDLLNLGVVAAILVGVEQVEELVESWRTDGDFREYFLPLSAVGKHNLFQGLKPVI